MDLESSGAFRYRIRCGFLLPGYYFMPGESRPDLSEFSPEFGRIFHRALSRTAKFLNSP